MKAYIGKSKLHGKGLFAKQNLKKGETIFLIKGKEVTYVISDTKKANKVNFDIFGVSKNTWIDPEKRIWLYFNHSCNPNTSIKGQKTIVASNEIKKGDEVTFDYSRNEADIFWSFKCNCGEKNCRKIIKSIQFLPEKVFKKNITLIPKYFRNVFIKFNISKFKNTKTFQDEWVNFIKS